MTTADDILSMPDPVDRLRALTALELNQRADVLIIHHHAVQQRSEQERQP